MLCSLADSKLSMLMDYCSNLYLGQAMRKGVFEVGGQRRSRLTTASSSTGQWLHCPLRESVDSVAFQWFEHLWDPGNLSRYG